MTSPQQSIGSEVETMVGTSRRSSRAALRALLWTLAAGFGIVLTVLAAGSASAASTPDDDPASAPVGDLVSDLTGGASAPLTDALSPVTAPVERTLSPVTQPVTDTARSVLDGPDTPAPGGPGDDTAGSGAGAEAEPTAPERGTSARAADDPSGPTDADVPASADAGTPSGPDTPADRDADPRDVPDLVDLPQAPVEVGDLDFGPRSFPADHGDHGSATAPTSASVVALDDAVAPRVGRDDLLTAVLAPHDTTRHSQTSTRPDVSPG